MSVAELLNLGRRAIDCPGWAWKRGMKAEATIPLRDQLGSTRRQVVWVDKVTPEGDVLVLKKRDFLGCKASWLVARDPVPDLSDPGNKGWLLWMVRKAWGIPNANTVFRDHDAKWVICWSGATHGGDLGSGDTEEEALVAALEAAR